MQRHTRPAAPEARSGVVTRLTTRAGQGDRTLVYLDGEPAGEIATVLIEARSLHSGDFLSAEAHAQLLAQDEPYRARSRALKILAAEDRSVSDIHARLTDAGFGPETVASTIAWLCDLGYLDDERYIRCYLSEKTKAGWGERRLRAELSRKGVARSLVDAYFEAKASDDESRAEERQNLLALVCRRFTRQWHGDPVATERRVAAFLARRGYDWDEVSLLLREFKACQEGGISE
jgi:regulatory protein